ncbi:hypothetical protein GCM10020219_055860 [Nonomuraea dietziae]
MRKAADHACRRFMDGTETLRHPYWRMAMVVSSNRATVRSSAVPGACAAVRLPEILRRGWHGPRFGASIAGARSLLLRYDLRVLPGDVTLRGHAVRALYPRLREGPSDSRWWRPITDNVTSKLYVGAAVRTGGCSGVGLAIAPSVYTYSDFVCARDLSITACEVANADGGVSGEDFRALCGVAQQRLSR